MAYRLAHRVIAHNRISSDELKDRLHVPEDKIAVIPHGNYLHDLRPMPSTVIAREKLGLPPQAKVLLFFGQIKDVKGLDILLSAMPTVLRHYSDAVLLIAGKPWKTDFAVHIRQRLTSWKSIMPVLHIFVIFLMKMFRSITVLQIWWCYLIVVFTKVEWC